MLAGKTGQLRTSVLIKDLAFPNVFLDVLCLNLAFIEKKTFPTCAEQSIYKLARELFRGRRSVFRLEKLFYVYVNEGFRGNKVS